VWREELQKNLIADSPISYAENIATPASCSEWSVGTESEKQVGKQGQRQWKRKKWLRLHRRRGWKGQNGRQPIGRRDKMAVGEFNQYRSPSFVGGWRTGRNPERAKNITSVPKRSRTFEVDTSSFSYGCVSPLHGYTRVTTYENLLPSNLQLAATVSCSEQKEENSLKRLASRCYRRFSIKKNIADRQCTECIREHCSIF